MSLACRPRHAGFTLLELLLALGVIGVLMGLLLPTLGRTWSAVDRTRTRAWFADWAGALELFRQEYGYYPDLTVEAGSSGRIDPARFLAALTGRDHRGAPAGAADLAGNRRALTFLSLPAEAVDAVQGEVLDGCGNRDVVVLVDADQDGWISGAEVVRVALRRGATGTGLTAAGEPPADAFPAEGIRGSIGFYSAGAGDWVFSWQ